MRYPSVKRMVDVVGAMVLLVAAAPMILAVAVSIRWRMGRPVLFRHVRAGYRERPFELMKFRTMREAFGTDGKPLPDAERLTGLGRFLRRTSLDELPQLLNVLRGEMSLVGPRPLLIEYLDRYTPEQARRHAALPGITGWSQIHGRNALAWEDKFKLDVWYVDHRSFWLDISILVETVFSVLRREGISHGREATMPEFLGTASARVSYAERKAA